jgi:hypothetical protein
MITNEIEMNLEELRLEYQRVNGIPSMMEKGEERIGSGENEERQIGSDQDLYQEAGRGIVVAPVTGPIRRHCFRRSHESLILDLKARVAADVLWRGEVDRGILAGYFFSELDYNVNFIGLYEALYWHPGPFWMVLSAVSYWLELAIGEFPCNLPVGRPIRTFQNPAHDRS